MSAISRAIVVLCISAVAAIRISTDSQCIPNANRSQAWNKSWDNTAFVVGGMGKYGKMPGLRKCVALAETLTRIGGWQGRVYIMTDDVPSASDEKIWTNDNQNIKFVHIEPVRDGVDFRSFSAGGGGGYLKTMMFDLPAISEDVLIWHDCDALIAEPGCIVDQLFADPNAALEFGPEKQLLLGNMPGPIKCPNENQRPGTTLDGVYCPIDLCHKDEHHNRCGDGFHVGLFAAHRRWSKDIINEWKKNQQLEPNTFDRYTLYDAWKSLGAKFGVVPFAWHDWMYGKQARCINHMSGPRVWDPENRGVLEPFLRSMCLRSMSYEDIYEVYANILKWSMLRNGTEIVRKEQRYFPLE